MTKAVILIPTSAEANLAAALDAAKTTGAVVFNAVEDVKAAQALIANNQKDVLLEKIVADFQALNANLVVVKGVQPSAQAPFANSLNFAIAQTLDAQIILVANNEEGTLVEAVASEFGGSYYILPSSIHEVILIPDDGDMDVEFLLSMVVSVNKDGVLPEDKLTDSVYYYDAEKMNFPVVINSATH